jgi:putative SOS response-associated peptidase YedK
VQLSRSGRVMPGRLSQTAQLLWRHVKQPNSSARVESNSHSHAFEEAFTRKRRLVLLLGLWPVR